MTFRNIEFRSPAEQRQWAAQREAEQREQAAQAEAEMLVELDAYEFPGQLTGRPPIKLPPMIARRVLDDLAAGASRKAIAAKYRPYFRFSERWLRDAVSDGRLERMANAKPRADGRRTRRGLAV